MFRNVSHHEIVAELDDCRMIDEIVHRSNNVAGGKEWIVRAYLDLETDRLRFVLFTSVARQTAGGYSMLELDGIMEFEDKAAAKDWLHGAEDSTAEVAYESYQTRKGYGYASHPFGGYVDDDEGRRHFNKPNGWWTYTITPGQFDWSELD